MGYIDQLKTQHTVVSEVTAELAEAGFSDAVEIGRGGFGVVYRCDQADLDRMVAIKVLTGGLDEGSRERFIREQRAMGRLTGHPNIVEVLQVGATSSGLPYLVMPFYPRGSLGAWISRHGRLSGEEILRLGVKLAGALETGHRVGILHRDIKPGNILISDYGEPALTDFGIARIPGGFHTTTGTVTGSPAFTAPEVLAGDDPTPAADVYGLGATLFAALTGHAAFERRSGEQIVAQFLRITSQPVPDLREHDIDDDIATVIEHAMARAPNERPSPAALGEQLQHLQGKRGQPVGEMAVQAEAGAEPQDSAVVPVIPLDSDRSPAPEHARFVSSVGAKPFLRVELTSFVGRRTELTEAKHLLTSSRLVTLTGIGGVGKTRLALRVATDAKGDFAQGVRLVELAELHDGALLPAVIAAAVGLRPRGQPVLDVLTDYLASHQLLLVLDNCEQIVDSTAKVAETLLRACPMLRILATSREPLNVDGEAVLRVQPLNVPDQGGQPSLRSMHRYDAVTLFVERAAAVVPGFALTMENVAAVTEICHRVDGLPLAIELAAARLRALSPEQILARLTDCYALLTRGSRSAPNRQQTLRWCIDWSYSLCTPAEQQAWAHMSVFAGGFELDAAEQVCSGDLAAENLLDVLGNLVDKSILIREESDSIVRFRLLETIREYGRDRLERTGHYPELLRRHRDWYRNFAERAEADWFSPRQPDWIARIDREQPNFREALACCLTSTDVGPDAALSLAATLQLFWFSRSQLGEARHWLLQALAGEPATATATRAKAIWRASLVTESQDDLVVAAALATQAQHLAEQTEDPVVHAFTNLTDSLHAVRTGDSPSARVPLEAALAFFTADGDVYGQVWCLLGLGWVHALRDDSAAALSHYEKALDIIESHGGSVHLVYALWGAAFAAWRQGDRDRALGLLRRQMQHARRQQDLLMAAIALETLAWVVGAHGSARRTAVLLGSAQALAQEIGASPVLFPQTAIHHEECERSARRTLGEEGFETAYRKGMSLDLNAATEYALGEPRAALPGPSTELTRRELEVAGLVADGSTNKAIASRLHISQRTAAGHVEHILTKLGFTSRTQIAAWVAEQNRPNPS
ncbi:protein kinase domain-containing protein [Nocardia miyunensis]|uniref:protein kinase domain-containing protein n=1 Tax=Nocardia miyunensis TaxID=282684 RepID=UPI0008377F7D|nr:protein kinase [Nocardia miyunensis]